MPPSRSNKGMPAPQTKSIFVLTPLMKKNDGSLVIAKTFSLPNHKYLFVTARSMTGIGGAEEGVCMLAGLAMNNSRFQRA